MLSFGPISELHKAAEKLAEVCCGKPGLVMPVDARADGVHSIFWLPSNMADYFEKLNKNERKNRRKYELRLLKKDHTVRVEVLNDLKGSTRPSRSLSYNTRYIGRHRASQGLSRMAESDRVQSSLGEGSWKTRAYPVIQIRADEQVVASQYTFAFGNSYFLGTACPARRRRLGEVQFGPTGIVTMIDEAIKEGKNRLEGGLAHYEYKIRLGAKEYAVRRVRVIANRAGSRMRVKLYNALRLCLLYGYHKIWYRRISPRLPTTFRKPQWMFWLRLDF